MDPVLSGRVTLSGVVALLLFLLASMVYGLWKALSSGGLCTGRELREKNQRIAYLEAALRTRDHQLSLVLTEAMTTINPVLKAMRSAVDADGEGADAS